VLVLHVGSVDAILLRLGLLFLGLLPVRRLALRLGTLRLALAILRLNSRLPGRSLRRALALPEPDKLRARPSRWRTNRRLALGRELVLGARVLRSRATGRRTLWL